MFLQYIQFLSSQPVLLYTIVILFSLCIGSFLNVVIYRLPIITKQNWKQECREFLDMEDKPSDEEKLSLWGPRSYCPKCKNTIKSWQNIPLLSYLFLRAKCFYCKDSISPRYFLVELITALLSVLVVWHFGPTLQALFALLLTWCLIPLTLIDFDEQILPDSIVLPLLWIGLAISILPIFADSHQAILGAIVGYGALWLFVKAFYLITGKLGMGHGDFKLYAVFGAWLGIASLPFIILCSSLVGAIIGGCYLACSKKAKDTPIPFGPYIAIAGWIALMWGNQITTWYLQLLR